MVKGISIELEKETGLGTVPPDPSFLLLQLVLLTQRQGLVVSGQSFVILATVVVCITLQLEFSSLLLKCGSIKR